VEFIRYYLHVAVGVQQGTGLGGLGLQPPSQAKQMFGAVTKFFRLQPAAKNEKKICIY